MERLVRTSDHDGLYRPFAFGLEWTQVKHAIQIVTSSIAGNDLVSLARYFYLQILDVLTTMAFLTVGAQEANPLVRSVMAAVGSSFAGLIIVKFLGLTLGFGCWRTGRIRLLTCINIAYAALVVWNLLALVLTVAQHN